MQLNEIEKLYADTRRSVGNSNTAIQSKPQIGNSIEERIEHTLLQTNITTDHLKNLCWTADNCGFRSICCLPRDVPECSRLLAHSATIVVTVVDFPLGGGCLDSAVQQTRTTVAQGADEVDMVLDVRSILEENLIRAKNHISSVVNGAGKALVKVIVETGYLSQIQIIQACAVARAAGASFVKTSTGFGPRGASVEDIVLMRKAVGDQMGIKASGGIKSASFAAALVQAGADLIGTSNGPACAGKQ